MEPLSESEWVEVGRHGQRLPLRIVGQDYAQRLVTRINGERLPFGGSWEFRLEPEGKETGVTITENGEVYNPVFRVVSRLIMGHSATIKKYSEYLVASFGR